MKLLKLLFIVGFVPYLFIGCLTSCKTTKNVQKTTYDSTLIKENEALKRVLAEEQQKFEKEKETWEETGVTFYPDNALNRTVDPSNYIPNDSFLVRTMDTTLPDKWIASKRPENSHLITSKVIFENGKVKSVEGNIKSINQSKFTHDLERYEYQKKIDSLSYLLKKKEVKVVTETKTVQKKTTVYPWLLFALCLLIGMAIEARFKLLKRIFPFINF